jgi:hypothetical protein
MSIEKIKAQMWFSAQTRELKDNGNNSETWSTARSIEDIPVKRMYANFQYLESELLPKIEAARGKESSDYRLFSDIQKNLLWAVMLASRYEAALKKNGLLQLQLSIQTELNASLQSELSKYTTMEDLFLSTGLDKIAAAVAKRVSEKLKP